MIDPRYKKLLKDLIKQADPDIDVSDTSNFSDLLINPLTFIMQEYERRQNRVLNSRALLDLDNMSESDLDTAASNFLIKRDSGAYYVGKIKLYYSSPVSINLPSSTIFESRSNGKRYVTIRSYSISSSEMSQNTEGSLYHSGDISVRSIDKVEEGFLQTGSQLNPTFIPGVAPVRIVVTQDITGGAPKETNREFFKRVQDTLKTNTLASSSTLSDKVSRLSNAIKEVSVVGAGDELMLRDLKEQEGLESNVIENFKHVRRGYNPDGHAAFSNFFQRSVPVDSETIPNLPTPNEFFTEFTDEQYRGVYALSEAYVSTQDQSTLFSVDPWTEEDLSLFSK